MNCKFCNNFIPDDAKVCSICGKSVEEEALVKTAEETVAVSAETAAAPAVPAEPEKPAKVYKHKSLVLPLVIILIAAAAFVYFYAFGGMAKLSDYQAGRDTDVSITETEDDSFDVGEFTDETVEQNSEEDSAKDLTVAYGANALAGLAGLGGVALFGKRAVGNSKAKKQ